jgi:putative endonuclease
MAAAWYVDHGYRVVARNWRSRQGEIDLIVARDGVLVFCEVKTRSGSRFGQPFEAVTRTKQLRLRRLAAEYLRTRPRTAGPPAEVRFDVASVGGGRVDVIEGAF